MRSGILYSSVRELLPDDERIMQVAHMWTRNRLTIPYGVAAFVGCVVIALIVGIDDWGGRVVIGLAGAAIATMATTEYRVLVLTKEGLVMMGSSRIRQRATTVLQRLPSHATVEPVGSNLVITDWSVDDHVYSVMKRHQSAMLAISQR